MQMRQGAIREAEARADYNQKLCFLVERLINSPSRFGLVRCFLPALSVLYLRVPARLFVVGVVEPVIAVADAELGHVLAVMRPALDGDSRDVLRGAQIDDQILLEIGDFRRPCVATLRSFNEK